MPNFGEKLRQERESRDTTIEEISAATGIGLSYLEALERNEFEALPGRAFGKLYIRAYAEVLKFDPGPLLADYDREQQARKMNEPPGGHPTKPIMVRPTMPAQPPQEEPPEDEREEPPEEPLEEPVEAPSEIPIEAAPTEEIDEEPLEALQEESAEIPHREPTEPPTEEPVIEEPELPEEPEPVPVPEELPVLPAKAEVPSAFEETHSAPEGMQDRRRLALVAALIGIPLLIVIAWILFGVLDGNDTESEPATSTATLDDLSETATPSESSTPPPETSGAPAATDSQSEATELPTEPAAETEIDPSPVDASAATGRLVVDEFGVGRKVVNHRLEDRDDRFREGEVVWFLTRVLGGRRGERIRHVWLHEGAAVQSIDLVIGGSHWRTQSNKTLWGLGSWTVEVRDHEDRVLARAAFTCVSR